MAKTTPKKKSQPKSDKPKKKPVKPVKATAPKQLKKSGTAGSSGKSFFRILFSKWMRRAILLIVVLILLSWQWDNIYNWITGTVTDTIGALGWGLILIVLAIIIIVCIIFRKTHRRFYTTL